MNKHLIALAAATVLAACGGGSDDGTATTSTAAPSAVTAEQLRRALGAGGRQVALAATPEQAAEQLLNFAQTSIYAAFFPGSPATQTFGPFRYRFYADTGIYLGVVVTAGQGYTMNGVYVMGGQFGNNPVYVGLLADFITVTDPNTGPAGPNNGCFDLALMDAAGTRIDLVWQWSGFQNGTVTQEWTINAATTFEGHANAVETVTKTTGTVTAQGFATPLNDETKSYARRTGDAEVTHYGNVSVATATAGNVMSTTTSKTLYNPLWVEKMYGLAAGQSLTETTTSVTTVTQSLGGTTGPTTSSSTETIRFVGREQVITPAKTFSACRYETTHAGSPNYVTTSWYIDGKGVPVKMVTTENGSVVQTMEVNSAKLNGQPL